MFMLFMCMNFSSRRPKEAAVNSYYSDACAHFDSLDRHFVARAICPFSSSVDIVRNELLPVVNITETLRNNLVCEAGAVICSCCIIPHFALRIYALCHFLNPSRDSYSYISLFFMLWAICLIPTPAPTFRSWDEISEFESRSGQEIFLFSSTSKPRLEPTLRPVLWVLGFVPGGKAEGAWSWPLNSILCQGCEWVELYLYSPYVPTWRGQ